MTEVEYTPVTCPFCGDEDLDLIGLKYHLTYFCDEYTETEDIAPPLSHFMGNADV